MSRIKELQCELSMARSQIHNLITENRILKVIEKRHENALLKYEGTHSQLPMLIRSYDEDIRTLQARLRRVKGMHRDLENRYRSQSTELLAVQRQHKHLLDLTKNKQLGEREKLSNQLEQAENTIKQHEIKIQSLMRKIELLCKNHRSQMNAEMSKTRQMQVQLDQVIETNKQLQTEKPKYQRYGCRRSNPRGTIAVKSSGLAIQSKNSKLNHVHDGRGDPDIPSSSGVLEKTILKPELGNGESEISDHTKELQKNLMTQIHEDVINKPDMLAMDNRADSADTKTWLNNGISELIKEKDLSSFDYNSDESLVQQTELTAKIEVNPFSVLNEFDLSKSKKYQMSINSSADNDVLCYTDLLPVSVPQKKEEKPFFYDEDDDDVSSISSVSESD